jgi:hypothetical protein
MSKFQPGDPPGPGRPKGRLNNRTLFLQTVMCDQLEPAAENLKDAIAKDKPFANKMVFDYFKRRGPVVRIELPPIRCADDVLTAQGAVVDEAVSGEMSISEAQAVSDLLENHRKAFETAVLARDIERFKKAKAQDDRLRKALAAVAKR